MAMSPKQRAELKARAKRGDQEAFTALIQEDKGWIKSIVWRIAGGPIQNGKASPEDLSQDAWTGWLEAWRNYDPGRGTPFQGFALKHVCGAVSRALARELGLSDGGRRAYPWVKWALASLASRGVSSPTSKEILGEIQKANPRTRITQADVEEVLQALQGSIPIVPGGLSEPGEEEFGVPEEVLQGELDDFSSIIELEADLGERLLIICEALGPDLVWKFMALSILRLEKEPWDRIAEALRNPNPSPSWKGEWEHIIRSDYPSVLKHFQGLDNWDEVVRRFQQPPPTLNSDALRQWFRRTRKEIIQEYRSRAAEP